MELIVSTLQEEWGRHYPRQCQLPLPIFHVFYILNLPPHRFSLSLSPPSSSFLPFLSSSLHSFFLVLFPSVFSSSCWFFHGLSISHFLLLWDGEGKVSLPSSYVSYWEGRVCFLFILLGSWSWWLRKPGWNTVPPLKGTARFLAGVFSDVLTGVPPHPPSQPGVQPSVMDFYTLYSLHPRHVLRRHSEPFLYCGCGRGPDFSFPGSFQCRVIWLKKKKSACFISDLVHFHFVISCSFAWILSLWGL